MGRIRSTKVSYNGLTFDSKLEFFCHQYLTTKEIEFELKPTYTIKEAFTYNGKRIRKTTWTPDFHLHSHNTILETKGKPNDQWALKKKMIMSYFSTWDSPPEIVIVKNQKEVVEFIDSL